MNIPSDVLWILVLLIIAVPIANRVCEFLQALSLSLKVKAAVRSGSMTKEYLDEFLKR